MQELSDKTLIVKNHVAQRPPKLVRAVKYLVAADAQVLEVKVEYVSLGEQQTLQDAVYVRDDVLPTKL